jgi:hypothetical protein
MGPSVPGRIPWTVIQQWAHHHGLAKGEMMMLDTVMMALDRVYLEWWSAKHAKTPEA